MLECGTAQNHVVLFPLRMGQVQASILQIPLVGGRGPGTALADIVLTLQVFGFEHAYHARRVRIDVEERVRRLIPGQHAAFQWRKRRLA